MRNEAALKSLAITPRELDVLEALVSGESNKELARTLGVSPNTVKTHIARLFDKLDGKRIDHTRIEFQAGFRNGRATAYRYVKKAVVHPDYRFAGAVSPARVSIDVALLQLDSPIRNGSVQPFSTDSVPRTGDSIGVVSYAHDRSEAPSLQEAQAQPAPPPPLRDTEKQAVRIPDEKRIKHQAPLSKSSPSAPSLSPPQRAT